MRILHPDLVHATSFDEAEAVQAAARELVRIRPLDRIPHRIAGCDAAYAPDADLGFGAVVAVDAETLRDIESHTAQAVTQFPYVPGFFAFRELPVLLEALRLLTAPPDVIVVNGHGIAHPRRAGLASHLGVVVDLPTMGCAKTPFGGKWSEPDRRAGSWSPLLAEGEQVGIAYRARSDGAAVFLSPGHLLDLEAVLRIAPALFREHLLPEPLHRAHALAARTQRRH